MLVGFRWSPCTTYPLCCQRGEHDLAQLARVEQQLTNTTMETHQELEKWQQMRELDRQLRGRGLDMRREIIDRQKKFNQMKAEREGKVSRRALN